MGVEISQEAVAQVPERLRDRMSCGTLTATPFGEKTFELVPPVSKVVIPLSTIIPRQMCSRSIALYIGEMFVIARRGAC